MSIKHCPTAFGRKLFQESRCLSADVINLNSVDDSTKEEQHMASHLLISGSGPLNSSSSTNIALHIVERIFRQELEADRIVCCGKHHHADVVDPKEQLKEKD